MTLENLCIEKIQQAKELGSHVLDLSFMGLSTIPEVILELEYLVELDLSNNLFTRLPSIINELKNLKYLRLRNNCFSYWSGIGFDIVNSLKIEYLDLSLNNLSKIPDDVFFLVDLVEIDLQGNPLMHGIPDTIIEQGLEAIHQFVEEVYLSETSDNLLEVKLIFVGQGEVGKTSLMKRILDPYLIFKEGYEPTTHGINVRKWNKDIYFSDEELVSILGEEVKAKDEDEDDFYKSDESPVDIVDIFNYEEDYYEFIDIKIPESTNENNDEYYNPLFEVNYTYSDKSSNKDSIKEQNLKEAKFNIWDFGGQEIYYSTHQFFLTKRSIYIFVWDARKEEDYDRFLYWFNTINVLSEKSPIIVVMNKSDVRETSIEEASLMQSFPNIIGFHRTSCLTGFGIKELESSIDIAFKRLPHIGDSLPTNWLYVREDLNKLRENYITYERFIDICKTYNISKSRANFLSSYLHDLGDILHFQRDEILLKIVILKPDWVTEAFYKLIDSHFIRAKNGKFLLDNLIHVWDLKVHPKEKHSELVRLIESFELCFNILSTKEYILPELLPINPSYKDIFFHSSNDTNFQYDFKFMPSGLMTKFICRVFLIIKSNSFWKNGVVIQYEDSLALIVSNVIDKKIDITINGDNREGLLGIIRKEFNAIFGSIKLNSEEDYFEMVPCNCDVCVKIKNLHYYKFSVLKKWRRKNITSTHCPISADEVNITSLIKGFEKIRPAERILEHLLITSSQLQGIQKSQISNREDDRNTFIAISLTNRGLIVKDQTRWGSSASGLQQGELDIKIESDSGMAKGIFEGFNLSYLDKTKINYHLEKIFNYDPNGLEVNYIVVYVDSDNFLDLWIKYKKAALEPNYKYNIISDFQDVTTDYNSIRGSNIRIGRIAFRINEDRNYIYHIFVKMNL